MTQLPLRVPLMPGTGKSDESAIDSPSCPTRLTSNDFEQVTPFDPHKTF